MILIFQPTGIKFGDSIVPAVERAVPEFQVGWCSRVENLESIV